MNPFKRTLLFRPPPHPLREPPRMGAGLPQPALRGSLGRSQDLFTYVSVGTVELEQADQATSSNTLAPYEMALLTMRGVAMLMPRYVDYWNGRAPVFSRYLVITNRVLSSKFTEYGKPNGPYWIDPTMPEVEDTHLGLPS